LVHPDSDATLPINPDFQAPEQPEEGAVWKVVEANSETDDEDPGVAKAEDNLVEDPKSEALHRLPSLSPLSSLQADLSPW
jgi:hypothetical protein